MLPAGPGVVKIDRPEPELDVKPLDFEFAGLLAGRPADLRKSKIEKMSSRFFAISSFVPGDWCVDKCEAPTSTQQHGLAVCCVVASNVDCTMCIEHNCALLLPLGVDSSH